MFGSRRVILNKRFNYILRGQTSFAAGMSESASTRPILNVENKIVARSRGDSHRNGIESQGMPNFPGDHMVRT